MKEAAMAETNEAIKQAFKDMLDGTSYDKITVSALCKKLGISRRTFYRHFETLDDVVEALVYDDFIGPVRSIRATLPIEEIKSAGRLLVERSHKVFYEERKRYRKLLNYKGNMSLVETITRETYQLNQEIYQDYTLAPDEKDFAAYFAAASSAMIFAWWITEREDIEPKRMAKLTYEWAFSHWNDIDRGKG
ncbi:MAG: TetR/AcrR family transcriptional regulator [Coriobacteriaceae bacterium]|nr:TetR/AcrR family transcriptional regulator [Coriobacteriaceae bacterium]